MGFRRIIERAAFTGIAAPLVYLTGNRWAQDALAWGFHITQHLMGIGSGSDCRTSGEFVLLKVLEEVADPVFVIFDVGANKGLFVTMVAEEWAREQVSVHAFEPSEETFVALKATAPQCSEFHLNNFALGDTDGEATLFSDEAMSGLASFTQRDMEHEGIEFVRSETVSVRTLDGYCDQQGVAEIDLLKIDVEGHELEVLKGAAKLFDENRVKMVSFEFGSPDIDSRIFFRDLFNFFRSRDYEIYRITRSGYLYHLGEYHEKHEQFRTTNYLCVRKELVERSSRARKSLSR